MFRIRDNRDVRGPLCGTIKNPWPIPTLSDDPVRIWISPDTLVRCRFDGTWDRIQQRLKGEHVHICPVKPSADKI